MRAVPVLLVLIGLIAFVAPAAAQAPGEPGAAPRPIRTSTTSPTVTATSSTDLTPPIGASPSEAPPSLPPVASTPPVATATNSPPHPPVAPPTAPPAGPVTLELEAESSPTEPPTEPPAAPVAEDEDEFFDDDEYEEEPLIAPEDDLAWELYHSAALKLAKGNRRVAIERLEEVIEAFPDHPAAEKAGKLLEAVDGKSRKVFVRPMKKRPKRVRPRHRRPAKGKKVEAPLPPGVERKTAFARTELVIGQAIHGTIAGIAVCRMLTCENGAVDILAANIGAGLAVGTSVLLTRSGVTPGHATMLNSGTMWGAWQGFALLGAVSPTEFAAGAWGILIASQLGGTGLGEILYRTLEPTAAQVSLANSTGIWAGLVTGMMFGATGTRFDSSDGWGTVLAMSDLGLIGGAVLGAYMPVSRSRMLLIDVSGLSGVLLGMGVALAADGLRPEPDLFWGMSIAGAVTGLALSTVLTRNWDLADDTPPVSLGVMPTEGGAMVSFGARM